MNSRKYIGFFVIGAIALFVTIYAITNETFNYQRYSNMESFEKEWAKVDSLEKKGLPKSAMEVVEKIYSKAKEIDNPAQIVKSLIHLMKYKTQLEEEGLVQSMYFLQEEIKTATFPTLPILQSFLADVYWGFYENNRWKFLDRTQTMNFDQDDILTWDLNKLFEKVMGLHQSALSETEKLKQIPLEIFDDIVVKNSSSRKFRPTVYDFVAHRALAFYMNEETGLTQPAYAFKLTEENVFSPASDFVKIKFETKDTLSLDLHAIQLMQDLIDFHIGDSDPSALVDIDLIRLSYVKNKSVHSLKETLYLDALKDLEKKYLFNEIGTEVSYQLASQYVSQANSYNPLVDDTYKWDRKTALEICDKAIERFPRAFGTQNCKSLRNQILSKELSLITEKVNLPNAPFRALVTYRNVDNVHFRILNYDKDVEQLFKTLYNDDLFKELVKIKPIKTWSVKIPNDGDMNSHSFEVKVPELGLGKYLILASPDEKFTLSKNAIAYTTTYISNISYIRRDNSDGTLDYYVLNRATGQPLPNVKVQIYYEVYDSKNYKYIYEKGPLVQTDELGYLKIPKTSGSRTVKCTFEYGDDFLDLEDKIYQYSPYDYEDRTYTSVVFFTDRGIYRPGQTIYFKGIMLETGKKQNKLLTNRSVTVELLDVNSQKVSSLALKTNDYGTFSGTFTAPTGVLTGAMTIRCQHGSKSVQVEEYKRPKFEVKFDPVTESFKLGDEVKITGFAQAYAGSNIDGAEVRYRVVRSATFPYWRWWWWSYRPISPDMEITSGVTSTDDKGKFEIKFEAIPDLSLDKKYKPQFTYTVYADVVDITGETRSNTTYVNVGYIALSVSLNMPAIVF
ncbi:MAG: hypothetical protein JW866_07280, partial [Ignavibacteriales bacterium]|nr:hypothetical protein [Ignavibacteriales bacterium]